MKVDTHILRGLRARCVAILAVLALAAVPAAAQAGTGGASTADSSDAQAGGDLAFGGLRTALATWYGPGLYGNHTACGQILRPHTLGVAHRSLPCGTPVKIIYHGRRVVTRVIDRGPYADGIDWDLTNGVRRLLGFEGAGQIRYAVAFHLARP